MLRVALPIWSNMRCRASAEGLAIHPVPYEDLTAAQVAPMREEFLPTLEQWYPETLKETGAVAASA